MLIYRNIFSELECTTIEMYTIVNKAFHNTSRLNSRKIWGNLRVSGES